MHLLPTSQNGSGAKQSVSDYRASLARAIAGTPEQCVEQIQQYVDNGIDYFFLLFPDPISSESLELFAREVMPHFNSSDN